MAKVNHYTANKEIRMDCGHNLKVGQPFTVTGVFVCEQEQCPWRILLANLQKRQPVQE